MWTASRGRRRHCKSSTTPAERAILLLIVYVLTCDLLEPELEPSPSGSLGRLNDQTALEFHRSEQSTRLHHYDGLMVIGLDEHPRGPKPIGSAANRWRGASCKRVQTVRRAGDINRAQINESQEGSLWAGAPTLISQSVWRPQNYRERDLFAAAAATANSRLTRPVGPPRRRRRRRTWSIVLRAEAIRLIRMEAPHSVQAGSAIRLRCLYETRGDKLQSLSWYRNGREFYRFQPFERRQPVLAFNTTGIHVDLSRSKNNTVYLVNTTTETSGRYRCEATGTTFQEVNLETYIDVLPASSSSANMAQSPLAVAIITIIVNTLVGSHRLRARAMWCRRFE